MKKPKSRKPSKANRLSKKQKAKLKVIAERPEQRRDRLISLIRRAEVQLGSILPEKNLEAAIEELGNLKDWEAVYNMENGSRSERLMAYEKMIESERILLSLFRKAGVK